MNIIKNHKIAIHFFLIDLSSFYYLFLAVLGFCCCMSFSLVVVSRGYSLVVVCSLIVVTYSIGSKKAMATHSSTLAWKL